MKRGLVLGRHDLRMHLFSSVVRGAGRLPEPQARCSWITRVPDWDVMGNDVSGNCVAVAGLNGVRTFAAATGRPIPRFTSAEGISLYSDLTGYVPGRDDTDTGSDFDSLGRLWQTRGVASTKIESRIRVNPGEKNLVKLALSWLGPLFFGGALPKSAEDDFDAGRVWDARAGDPPLADEGHEMMIGGYDGDEFQFITWGRVQTATWSWIAECSAPALGGDIQAVVTDQWIRSNEFSPSMIHLDTVRRDAGLLLAASDTSQG